jgi:YVTN family beta-propeller protein
MFRITGIDTVSQKKVSLFGKFLWDGAFGLPLLPHLGRLRRVPTLPRSSLVRSLSFFVCSLLFCVVGCRRNSFPDVPDGYREFAYVSNGGSNTVSVLDVVYLRQDRTLQVGSAPTGLAANPVRNEVYVANSQSGSISVIDAEANRVVAAILVHRQPSFIAVDHTGHRAYVANTGSNSVSVLDLDRRREIAAAGAGELPGVVRISPDGRTLVVTNRGSGSVSIFEVSPYDAAAKSEPPPRLRTAFPGCPGASDAAILPDSSKVFVACSAGHQVMAVSLAAAAGSRQNPLLMTDHMLTLLDVGKMPVHLAMKPDGGEIFVSNYDSDSITEISTGTNEVGGTYPIGNKPVGGIVSKDNGRLWVANSGADSLAMYSIDDGRLTWSVRAGSGPVALAFSEDEHLLLATDSHSGDVAVVRTESTDGRPALFTILPAGVSPNSIVVKAIEAKP